MQKSKQVISRIKTDNENNTTLSIYKDSLLRPETYVIGERMLKERFNNLNEEMSIILLDRVKEHGFTNKRFMDAVKFVLDTHKFPTITPADIIQFDNVLNLRTWEQVSFEGKEFGSTIWQYYKPTEVKGKCYYIHIRELEKYNITLPGYKPKPATNKTTITPEPKPNKPFSMLDCYDQLVANDLKNEGLK